MIVGVTGTLGAGKGTVVEFLIRQGFKHYSVREFLTKEILKRGLVVNRDGMVMVANDLRERYGPGYIIEKLCALAKEDGGDVVIESVRALGEVEALRDSGGLLFAVDADIHQRYSRIQGRGSETDDVSFEEFALHEKREMDSVERSKGNIRQCMNLADFVFHNSGLVDELFQQIEGALKNISDKDVINRGESEGVIIEEEKSYVRPSWDEYFLGIMEAVARRGTCDRGRSGCVVVRDKQILVTGYVGSPVGLPHCDEVGHQMKKTVHEDGRVSSHCVRTAHAEQNAICLAAKRGICLDGSTIYVSMTPCPVCAKMLINSGVERVVCKKRYHNGMESEDLFREGGVKFDALSDDLMEYENQ